jgi:hypothetical protein
MYSGKIAVPPGGGEFNDKNRILYTTIKYNYLLEGNY